MITERKMKYMKLLLHALKIGVGSSLAIYIAHLMNLDYAATAGSIALLTIVTTKWGTVRLSVIRVVTFILFAYLGGIVFTQIPSDWVAYGIFVFGVVIICEMLGWKSAISVNALVGMHFLTHLDEFNIAFIWNEFLLLVIGISISIILNLFHAYRFEEEHLKKNMRYVENKLKEVLVEVAEYLEDHEEGKVVWKDIDELETDLEKFIFHANEYQDNTFDSHPGYYMEYFEMRHSQCKILKNLQKEIKKMKKKPKQAAVVAEYIRYLAGFVVEKNIPAEQMIQLEHLFENVRQDTLPKTRDEFENRALLYHTLMDLEDFLNCKKEFVENLDETKMKIYWNS